MPKAKLKKVENDSPPESQGPAPISTISKRLDKEYQQRHLRLTKQILALQSKLDEKKDELKALNKEIKAATAADGALWSQIEFAF